MESPAPSILGINGAPFASVNETEPAGASKPSRYTAKAYVPVRPASGREVTHNQTIVVGLNVLLRGYNIIIGIKPLQACRNHSV